MKLKLLFLILLPLVFSNVNLKESRPTVTTNPKQNWIASFNEFRNALYQNDKVKLKSFFKFPVLNEGNEIWYSIEDEHQLTFEKDEIKPFTETDFNNYCHKLFDQYFINSLLKIKTKELLNKGRYETAMMTESGTSYQILATFDKNSKQLILNFYTEEKVETGKNQYENAEFSKIYYFDILPTQKIQFNKVRIAG